MMKKKLFSIVLLVLAALLFTLAPTAQAALLDWTSSIDGGYRIAFVTETMSIATSTDITTYNTTVADDAAGSTLLDALGATWNCIGSTETVSAKVNTGTTLTDGGATDVPIYTPAGVLLATGNADLWDGTSLALMARRDGTPITETYRAFTGTTPDGSSMTAGDGRYLGFVGDVRSTRGNDALNQWIGADSSGNTSPNRHLFAMSGVIGGGGFNFDPTPADGASVPAADPLALSWANLPEPNSVADTISVEVFWDTGEAGDDESQSLTLLTSNSTEVTSPGIGTFHWKIVATDPNTGYVPVVTEAVYSLTTTSTNVAPSVNIDGGDRVAWFTDGIISVPITSVVTDADGPDALSYEWFVDDVLVAGETTDSIDLTEADLDVPLLGATNVYAVRLEAYDGEATGEDTVTITVYADGCEAAKGEAPEYTEAMAREIGDTNYDCAVNLVDLAAMALNWLTDESL
ncbi:MAG: hypothetical protein FVQ82_10680 [Planctomycetes bacterium]|nr:hypothetical protein [Planctomycetota bacterium]